MVRLIHLGLCAGELVLTDAGDYDPLAPEAPPAPKREREVREPRQVWNGPKPRPKIHKRKRRKR